MRTDFRFTWGLKNGLHARPASLLAEAVRRFSSEVTLGKEGAAPVNVRSVLSLIGLDVRLGDAVVMMAEGDDAQAAISSIRGLVESGLGEEESLGEAEISGEPAVAAALPVGLRRLAVAHAIGRSISAGIGTGAAVILSGLAPTAEIQSAKPRSIEAERTALRLAVDFVSADLRRKATTAGTRAERDLLRAHSEIASDPALWAEFDLSVAQGKTASQAVCAAAESFAAELRRSESEYIRERAADIQDVCLQLLDRLSGGRLASRQVTLSAESIVFADALAPSQLMRLDRRLLKGLVLGAVGATSHTSILARSLQIPAVSGVRLGALSVSAGEPALVDADAGFVITTVTPGVSRYYAREQITRRRRRERMEPLARQPAVTTDGRSLEVSANASSAPEIAAAVGVGADGVGLFRTEALFLERESPPSEEEQFQAYSEALDAAQGRSVIFRTFDLGGDKPAPYMVLTSEENPFLGVRGLRLYRRWPELLQTQLRALLKASAGRPQGAVRIMAPMVATAEEASWFRERVRGAESELRSAGVDARSEVPVGIMIEIPGAALILDQLADTVDFFSVGTNDLCQYWMAADRGNGDVAGLCDPRQPSFLRFLRSLVQSAKAHNKWIGICGEMAGDRLNLPLMIGMGFDEISVSAPEVGALKSGVREADAAGCAKLVEKAVAGRSVEDVKATLAGATWRRSSTHAIISADLIEIGADAATKEEAIKAATDLLYIAGRTERPREVEEAVWAREETYSTGLGFGFAVPHCKSDSIAAPSLAVLKLASAVEWGSNDGLPVSVVLLLAVPKMEAAGGGSAGHMKVFATLARRLMHEEFRHLLGSAADAASMEACLKKELGIE